MDTLQSKMLSILELPIDKKVSLADIKKAYRELCIIWHPDRAPENLKTRTEEKLKEINAAYSWIVANYNDLRFDARYSDQHTRKASGRQNSRTNEEAKENETKGTGGSQEQANSGQRGSAGGHKEHQSQGSYQSNHSQSWDRRPQHKGLMGYLLRVEKIEVAFAVVGVSLALLSMLVFKPGIRNIHDLYTIFCHSSFINLTYIKGELIFVQSRSLITSVVAMIMAIILIKLSVMVVKARK